MNRKTAKRKFLTSMTIFGTVGIFVRFIPLSSEAIAFFRGLLGLLFLAGILLLTRKRPDWAAIRKNLLILCLSGIAIGGNWILLFESYHHTTVATATVCYYLAPLFLVLASPLLGEKLTVKKLSCIAAALAGLVCVSGVLESSVPQLSDLRGIFLAIGAAILYATVMLLNKKLSPIPAHDKTILQLGASTAVILPYLLLTQGPAMPALEPVQLVLLLIVGIVHTGVAYTLYFGAMKDLNAQTVAVFSYLDPVIAIVLSALILQEPITALGALGAVLILGSALYSELPTCRSVKK